MTHKTPTSWIRAIRILGLLFPLAALLGLAAPAHAVAPLAYDWSCVSRSCSFTVTTSNHGAYKWAFGDGTFSSKTTSTTASHFYNIPVDDQFHNFTVYLSGYATLSSPSPDNVIGCDITVAASNVGIGTSGSCS